MNTYDSINVEIKVVPIFSCCVCGRQGRGDTARITMSVTSIDLIHRACTNVHPMHLPARWASYGADGVRCPEHVI